METYKRIILQDGEAVAEETIVKSRVSMSDFTELLTSVQINATPVLYPGTVLFGKGERRMKVITEHLPQTYAMRYRNKEYRIGFPFHYFIMEFHSAGALTNTRVAFANAGIKMAGDNACHACLPNTGNDSKICMGSSLKIRPGDPIRVKVGTVINHYLGSDFNDDLADYMPKYLPSEIKKATKGESESRLTPYFKAWAKLTKSGQDMTKLNWKKWKTFGELLED